MERSIAMYKPFCICLCLLISLPAAWAQPGVRGGKVADGPATEQAHQARRVALRNALQAQRSMGAASHSGSRGGERELSVQERGELRQQLRQQRREAMKQ